MNKRRPQKRPVKIGIVKEIIDERGWTPNRLATEAGLHPRTVASLFKTGKARIDIVGEISKILGVSCNLLLADRLDQNPDRTIADSQNRYIVDVLIKFIGSLNNEQVASLDTIIATVRSLATQSEGLCLNGFPVSGSVIVPVLADQGALEQLVISLFRDQLYNHGVYGLSFRIKDSSRLLHMLAKSEYLDTYYSDVLLIADGELSCTHAFEDSFKIRNAYLRINITKEGDQDKWFLEMSYNDGRSAFRTIFAWSNFVQFPSHATNEYDIINQFVIKQDLSIVHEQVMRGIARGLSYENIAIILKMDYSVIENAAQLLLKKYEVETASELRHLIIYGRNYETSEV